MANTISKIHVPNSNFMQRGKQRPRSSTSPKFQDTRLWRRFSQVEKLPPPKRKQIVQILDAFLGCEKAKKTG